MAITFTGNKYTGTLTSAGTTTVTDSAATFTTSDFAYNIPRMIWLFRSGVPVAFARSILASSSTVIVLDSPFVDYDGDEVTQVIGDTYYVSQDHNDVATTGWSVSGNVVTITDQVVYGTAGSYTSLFLHMEDVILEHVGFTAANPDNALFIGLGGCVSYGNPIDVKGRVTGSRCITNNISSTANSGHSCKNLAHTQMHFGTKMINTVNNPGGTSSSNFTPGFWQVFMNCEMVNCNFTSPAGGGPWTSRETFQRVINPVSVAGQTNALNLRWSNGYVEGGSFSCPGGGLSPFGADANGTYYIGGAAGERLAVYASAKNTLFRSNVSNTYTVNFTNLLTQDSFKTAIASLGPNYNTNATFNFIWTDTYSSLTNGTKVYVEDTNDTQVFAETVGASGETSDIDLTYQTRTFPTTSTTSDTFYNPWNAYLYKYGKGLITTAIDVFDDTLAGRTVKNIEFGGPVAQVDDLLITESTKATVDAYTNHNTAQQIYDADAADLEDNLGTRLSMLVSRTGNVLEIGAGDWTLDSTASGYDYSTQTVQASTFTGGFSASTGSITITGAVVLDGSGGREYSTDVVYDSTATTITDIDHTGAWDFTTAGTYTIDNCSLDEVTNSSGGAVTLVLINGASVNTNTGPNITITQPVTVSNANIIDGSRVQLWNVTQSVELDNSTVSGGSGYSISIDLLSADVAAGDVLRLRATQAGASAAKKPLQESGTVTIGGLSFIGTQEDCPTYATWGLDGSSITKFSADYVNDDVDIIVASNFELREFGAWWAYNLTTSQGIADFYGGVEFVDSANILIHNATVNVVLDNSTATNIHQTDNRRLYRDDLTRPVKDPTTGGGGIDIEWRSPVSLANIDTFNSKIDTIDANLDAVLADTNELQTDWADGGRLDLILDARASQTSVDTVDTVVDAVKAKTDQLNFTGSDVQSVASNMRGTDGANTVAPDNSGIATIKAKTDQLNFTGSDVQSVASNMRGTDGANTVAPDNTSIGDIKSKTDQLNFTGDDVKATLDGEDVTTDDPSRLAARAKATLSL